jgi:hypothetical protein
MFVLQPPRAVADSGNDFVARLKVYGIDLSELMGHTITPQSAIELGQDICGDIRSGTSPTVEAKGLYNGMPRIKQSANLVYAAQSTICPETLAAQP